MLRFNTHSIAGRLLNVRLLLLACGLLLPGFAVGVDMPAIAASADMSFALKDMANNFTRQTNKQVKLFFGASSALAQQIADGVKYEIFLSADEASVLSLAQRGKSVDEGKVYGVGRVVLFTPSNRKQQAISGGLAGLKTAIESGRLKRLAISNPDLCPYGRAAREALQEAGLWAMLGEKLVMTEDAGQATQLAFAGKVDVAVLPLSLAISPLAQSKGKFEVIEVKAHRSLRQRMVLLTDAGETAKMFYAYLQSPVARDILRRYGYSVPLN